MAYTEGELKISRDNTPTPQPLGQEAATPAPLQAEVPPDSPSSPYALKEDAAQPSDAPENNEVTWTASEFVAHEKTTGWYIMLALATVVLAAVVYLVTKDFVSMGVIVFGALILGVFAAHQPRELTYRVDRQGIQIAQKHYGYDEFRSFAVMQDGAFANIALVPLKRFAPLITMYYAPSDEDAILQVLANYLPHEERKPDAVDAFMRRIRF